MALLPTDALMASASFSAAAPRICIVQYTDLSDAALGVLTQLLARNAAHCAAVPGCLHLVERGTMPHVSPLWVKPFLLRKALRERGCAAALWLDTDAVLTAPSAVAAAASPAAFTQPRAGALIVPDPLPWTMPFNSGVMLLRNRPCSDALLSFWASLYPADDWYRTSSGHWCCCPKAAQRVVDGAVRCGEAARIGAKPEDVADGFRALHAPSCAESFCGVYESTHYYEQQAFWLSILTDLVGGYNASATFKPCLETAAWRQWNRPCASYAETTQANTSVHICHFLGTMRERAKAYLAGAPELPERVPEAVVEGARRSREGSR